jgi:hypothetical protein
VQRPLAPRCRSVASTLAYTAPSTKLDKLHDGMMLENSPPRVSKALILKAPAAGGARRSTKLVRTT